MSKDEYNQNKLSFGDKRLYSIPKDEYNQNKLSK